MIEIRSLIKRYGNRTVLDIPALDLLPGERYALIGANGSGKTTLISILAGQCRQDAGSVDFSGIRPDEIGYLPQSPYAFDMTVLKNVMLATGSGQAAKEQACAAIEKVGLTHLLHARGNRLSGGETQRMALARVLARPWKLLLLDEPTSSSDILASDAIEAALLAYAAETHCTLLFSSHAPGQARRLATRIVLLDAGKVAEAGKSEQVLHAPETPEAQRFLAHWTL